MNQDSSSYQILYNFSGTIFGGNNGDAGSPKAGLIEAGDGTLYGTTYYGGTSGNGTVFKINKDGSGFMILHNFLSSDGSAPWAPLVEDDDGTLYGTTITAAQRVWVQCSSLGETAATL